jgi:glycerol-3-phosphate acyltransferase PlsY
MRRLDLVGAENSVRAGQAGVVVLVRDAAKSMTSSGVEMVECVLGYLTERVI